jgi:molybdopterin synthase catalytic subunit
MALAQLERLAESAKGQWPVRKLAIVHRLGRVDPTEASVAVAVSCPHRSEAFEAAKWLIDELKHQVPIWKQEHYVQSGAEWIHPTDGNCRCTPSTPPLPTASQDIVPSQLTASLSSTGSLQQQSLRQQSQQQQ